MASKKNSTTWRPGQSGNPKGRTPGIGKVALLRQSIEQHVPAILQTLAEQAKSGDVQAARVLIERVVPAIRPQELAQAVPLQGDTLTERAESVLQALSNGQLGVQQATQLLGAVSGLAKLMEIDELARRVEALEQGAKHGKP